MSNIPDFAQLCRTLEAAHIPFGVLDLQGGAQIVICQRGGRLFGPFIGGRSIGWIEPTLAQPESFAALLESGQWNIGGDRFWIAPEVQFNMTDRFRNEETFDLPPQMDPGSFILTQVDRQRWMLAQSLTMQAYNLGTRSVSLDLESTIQPADDPLRAVQAYHTLSHSVQFTGYSQTVTLRQMAGAHLMAESWNVFQVPLGGVAIIPAAPPLEAVPYFGDPVSDALHVRGGAIRVTVTGSHQYKVGYKAAHVTGKLAYFQNLDERRSALFIRHFPNNPSSVYADEPPATPGRYGQSVHFYNGGGMFDGYGELECNGQTIGGSTGRSTSTDTFTTWVYTGSASALEEVALHLLGVSLTA